MTKRVGAPVGPLDSTIAMFIVQHSSAVSDPNEEGVQIFTPCLRGQAGFYVEEGRGQAGKNTLCNNFVFLFCMGDLKVYLFFPFGIFFKCFSFNRFISLRICL